MALEAVRREPLSGRRRKRVASQLHVHLREQGTLPTTGIPYVIVNGVVVVRDSEVLEGLTPGQAIRFPVQGKGRFEPLSAENWEATFIGTPMGFGGLDAVAE